MLPTLLCALTFAGPGGDDEIVLPTHKKVLANGMTVILAPDRQTPLVAVRLFYKVGSRNEWPGALRQFVGHWLEKIPEPKHAAFQQIADGMSHGFELKAQMFLQLQSVAKAMCKK